jgi:CRISPR-associated protein Cmr6
MVLQFPLPRDTRQKFTDSSNQKQCSNLGLLLDRYVGYLENWQFNEEQKTKFFQEIKSHFKFNDDLVRCNYRRWQAIAHSFPHAQTFTGTPEWRMVVGLGRSSILETSMMLDHITGIPIIPGSALKGLAASYALLCILEKTNRTDEVETMYRSFLKKEIAELPDHLEDYIQIFGHQGEVGKVIFLDAVPTKAPVLEPDIMNSHYPEYYGDKQGQQAPTPYQNPVPVYFLTLGKKSQFAFAIVGRDEHPKTQHLVEQSKKWLQAGLFQLGIGAKTAAGYGYLEIQN